MKLDYSKDSKIDINALDLEWAYQSELEEKYIRQCAELKKEVIACTENEKIAHEELKTKRSELILHAHNNAQELFDKPKATAPEVEAYYRTHEEYKEVKQDWIDSETELLEAESAHRTAENMKDLIHFTKTKALEELVNLHGQGYFAGPKVPRNLNKEIEKREEKQKRNEKTSKKIGSNLKRTTGKSK